MNKIILTILIGVAVAGFGLVFLANKVSSQSSLITSTAQSNPMINFDVLNLLAKLQATQIDATFFDGKLFTSLEDFSLEVVEEPIGRDNPFLPVGNE